MSYIEKELGTREKLIYQSGISWWILSPYLFAMVAVLILAIPAIIFFGILGGGIFLLVGIVFCLLLSLQSLIEKFTTEIAITDQRVLSKKGWLSTQVITTPLSKVNNINVYQSFLGNMFNYGNIEITTATTEETDNHILKALASPDTFRNILSEEIDKQEQAGKINK